MENNLRFFHPVKTNSPAPRKRFIFYCTGVAIQMASLAFLLFFQANQIFAGTHGNPKKAEKARLVVAGSVSCKTTVAAPLAKKFARKQKMEVKIYSGGSETGILAVYNRVADMAISTRPLSEEERGKGLQDTVIAYDAIAVIVHKKNPIRNLSLKDLNKILRGKIKRWKKFKWHDLPISVILPDTGSGMRRVFLQKVLQGNEMKVQYKESLSTFGAVAALQKDTLGIAICSLSQTKYAHVKTLSIDGITPTPETIADRSYPLWVPISLVTLGSPNEKAKRFADWLTRGPAAKLLTTYFVVPKEQREFFSE